jgi:hypothetical protein
MYLTCAGCVFGLQEFFSQRPNLFVCIELAAF